MRIGNVEINGYCALAPMAGVADRAMREICVKYGASFTVGELTSAKGVVLGDDKSKCLLACYKSEGICASQLFGCESNIMAKAAQIALNFNPDFIDINMGCPAPKISGNGGGSALMKNTELAGEIVSAVVKAIDIPVTVKMRAGWDDDNLNAPQLAKVCEQAGAKAVTVHARTRKQMYAPPVNLDIIKQVKQAVKIPVIGNGDICDGESAENMYKYTGCDFVMVGRSAMGNPFVFEQINAYFKGIEYKKPTLQEKLKVCIEQINLMREYKDPYIAMLEARKHTAWYLSGINGAANLRRMCGEIKSMDDVLRVCEKALEQNKDL